MRDNVTHAGCAAKRTSVLENVHAWQLLKRFGDDGSEFAAESAATMVALSLDLLRN
jgi:hypothetical protein